MPVPEIDLRCMGDHNARIFLTDASASVVRPPVLDGYDQRMARAAPRAAEVDGGTKGNLMTHDIARSTTLDTLRRRPRVFPIAVGVALLGALAGPGTARATMSLASWTQHSPDDISAANIPGLLTLTGNDVVTAVALPFTVTIEGVELHDARPLDQRLDRVRRQHPRHLRIRQRLPADGDAHQPLPCCLLGRPQPLRHHHPLRHGRHGAEPDVLADYEVDLDPRRRVGRRRRPPLPDPGARELEPDQRPLPRSGNLANGQSATIGFQGAGGAGGNAQPLTCNGKVLDDNRPNEGFSVDVGRAAAW